METAPGGSGALDPALPEAQRPRLLFFYSARSGRCRRVDGFLALVLQRRRNHRTFKVVRVPVEEHPELTAKFRVSRVPTIVVMEDRRIRARLECPKGRSPIEDALRPWLR
jgi:thioredoxin-like negative regulator of GroEL